MALLIVQRIGCTDKYIRNDKKSAVPLVVLICRVVLCEMGNIISLKLASPHLHVNVSTVMQSQETVLIYLKVSRYNTLFRLCMAE